MWHDPTTRHEDGELKAVRALREAIAAGADDATLNAAIDAAFAAEAAEDRKAAAREASAKQRADKARAQHAAMDKLIREKGYDEQEAEAEITGQSIESIRKRDFMEQARKDGHTGDSFDAVLTQYHLSLVGELETQAEAATNGHMMAPGQVGKMHPGWFWFTSSDDVVRKHASDELLAWFDEHGRLTRSELRRQILSGTRSMQVQQRDFLQ